MWSTLPVAADHQKFDTHRQTKLTAPETISRSRDMERQKTEETIGRKYNGLQYWEAIIKVHNRIQLLKWSGIILSTYIESRGSTRFITDSDSVVPSSAERYQHSPTAAVHVYMYLTTNGFPCSAFPEYSCLSFSTPATLCRCLRFSQFPLLHFCAADSFLAVSITAFWCRCFLSLCFMSCKHLNTPSSVSYFTMI